MADLLVVGSVAFDSVQTPFGKVEEALGGSATYFSYCASFFWFSRYSRWSGSMSFSAFSIAFAT